MLSQNIAFFYWVFNSFFWIKSVRIVQRISKEVKSFFVRCKKGCAVYARQKQSFFCLLSNRRKIKFFQNTLCKFYFCCVFRRYLILYCINCIITTFIETYWELHNEENFWNVKYLPCLQTEKRKTSHEVVKIVGSTKDFTITTLVTNHQDSVAPN